MFTVWQCRSHMCKQPGSVPTFIVIDFRHICLFINVFVLAPTETNVFTYCIHLLTQNLHKFTNFHRFYLRNSMESSTWTYPQRQPWAAPPCQPGAATQLDPHPLQVHWKGGTLGAASGTTTCAVYILHACNVT